MKKTIWANCFLLALLFLGIKCDKEDDMYEVGNEHGEALGNIIAFTKVSPIQLEADSISVCAISVKIHREATAANKQVKFFTDGGVFANGDTLQMVIANSDGYATAYLISDLPKKTNVRVSVMDTYFIDTIVNFVPSLPDDMLIDADSYSGDTAASFQITSTLFRDAQRGKVSDPVKVLFSVTPLDTTINLVYPQFAFSEDQAATVTLINPYKVTGRFSITSKTAAATGDSLSRTVLIEIK